MLPKFITCRNELTIAKSLPKHLTFEMFAKAKKVKWAFSIFVFLSLLEHCTASSENILSLIRNKHERTGQCRLQCVQQLANVPRDSDCQRHLYCKSCWDLCPEFISQKSYFETFCADEDEPSCDRGCKMACNFVNDTNRQKYRKSKEFLTPPTQVELSTNFLGCTLYWKTSGGGKSAIYLHQLYGMDEQETWFDIGQTVESFHVLTPDQSARAVKIRLLSISADDGTVAETEVNVKTQDCKAERPVQTGSVQLQTGFLFQNRTVDVDQVEAAEHPNSVLVVMSSVLLTSFVLMIVYLIFKRRDEISTFLKRKNEPKEAPFCGMDPEPNNYRISNYLQSLELEENRHLPVIHGGGPSDNLGFYV